MANKMLIDASHPEETRVVVLRGNRVEEFDFEAASKKPLRGNIYLAKVTRVEPSLQAAFVEYGGNRHGFLAFSEIHPDYYQIPVADRQALLEEDARAQAEDAEDEQRPQRRSRRFRKDRYRERRRPQADEAVTGPAEAGEEPLPGTEPAAHEAVEADSSAPPAHDDAGGQSAHSDAPTAPEADAAAAPVADAAPVAEAAQPAPEAPLADHVVEHLDPELRDGPAAEAQGGEVSDAPGAIDGDSPEAAALAADEEGDEEEPEGEEEEPVEQIGGDAMEEMPVRRARPRRQYKIQEVIKRRQVLLVQVVKEERGNKGAALTTYLSLAGRYSVLMPNTARGGGISRKITDAQDRRRLKEIVQELEVPEGMGIILRTAGAARTTGEVKRDFEYLLRMWETVREMTLQSTAPTLVYEEGSLIKRSIRDLYNKDIDDIHVAGDEGFKEAQNFMRLLMPSHVDNVKQWTESQPLFARFGVEQQLDAMYSNHVTLKSGGYIVIGQTEALVAIDVNSGRSTREHNIEDTALRTNLEAADEVARQLRLRDLAGLIVVDFIDMEEHRNNRAVERRMKDALKNDRARIQVGHISHFGLLEMSRQRIRTGVLEGSTVPCSHCAGSGMVRSTSSIALHVLRVLEDALIRNSTHNITIRTRPEVALYMLNQKRAHLSEIEKRFGVMVTVASDDTLTGALYHAIERGDLASPAADYKPASLVRIDSIAPEHEAAEPEDAEETETEAAETGEENDADAEENGDGRGRRRRRRRRRGRGEREGSQFQSQDAPQPNDAALAVMAQVHGDLPTTLAEATVSDGETDEAEAAEFDPGAPSAEEAGDDQRRGRRRRSRGGRNRGERERGPRQNGFGRGDSAEAVDAAGEQPQAAPEFGAEPAWTSSGSSSIDKPPAPVPQPASAPEPVMAMEPAATIAAPPAHAEPEPPATPEPPRAVDAPLPVAQVDPAAPKRAGWWQRAKASFGS